MRTLMLLFLLTLPFNAEALSYSTINDMVILSGTIEEHDLITLPLHLTPTIRAVVFNNMDGGDATTTLALLRYFEAVPRVHIVRGYCASACTLFFLAGNVRILDGYLGFHSVYSYETNKINYKLSNVFKNYVALRLGEKYDSTLFNYVFAQITDCNDFLIFAGANSGQLCNSSKCTIKTAKNAVDLGLVTK